MKLKLLIFNSLILLLITSCVTPGNVVYFQDAANYNLYNNIDAYQVFIHQDDLLAIMVNSKASEAAVPFNMPIASYYVGGTDVYGQQRYMGYLVDKEGNIDFPIIGKMHVEGLTRNQVCDLVKKELVTKGLLKEPIVSVNFLNFRVSVMGEVNRPGTFNVTGERITLLEALSMAGDLTIYGKRDRIAVIREREGKRTMLYHDLTSTEIFNSPCYFLQQNDIVYVEPNNRRMQQSEINQNNNASIWLSIISMTMTATSIIINLSR